MYSRFAATDSGKSGNRRFVPYTYAQTHKFVRKGDTKGMAWGELTRLRRKQTAYASQSGFGAQDALAIAQIQ